MNYKQNIVMKKKENQENANSIINTIDNNITHGVKQGVLHLTANNDKDDITTSQINNKQLLNFSSYSYLNLEKHPKLTEGCINSVKKYGTQFGFSRAFLSIDLYDELEIKLAEIFKGHVVIAPSTTLAHQAALPVLVGDNDAIIIDQYAHASIYFSAKIIKERGVHLELVRHNRVDLIEEKVIALRQKYDRIWYLCDGVYSMYGDYAPVKDLEELMNKYAQFNIYIDDAHGMSWKGENGKGYVLSEITLHQQMVLVTSLNKGFAGAGGVLVLPNSEWKRKIRTCGGTLIFSTPIQPPMLGTDLASANIHLSEELSLLQNELEAKIKFCAERIKYLGLPEISQNNSPVFYLPTSFPKVSYNLTKRMMDDGYYLTPTLFPAVSMRKAGIRFCINVKNTKQQINDMLESLAKNYPLALKESNVMLESVYKSFNLRAEDFVPEGLKKEESSSKLKLVVHNTIMKVNKDKWDHFLGDNGSFDWNALKMYEETFTGNPKKEDNWSFYYFEVLDEKNTTVLLTFFTKAWCKDDIFKNAEISEEIELIRQNDSYYLCTESLMMGTLVTEGQHIYFNKESQYWEESFILLMEEVNRMQFESKINAIYLRDFDTNDNELADLLIANGYVKTELPDYVHVLSDLDWDSEAEYLSRLGKKRRQQVKIDVSYQNKYEIEIKNEVTEEELFHFYQLYLNVKKRSALINTFDLPFEFFKSINETEDWEMIVLKLSDQESQINNNKQAISVVFSHKGAQSYTPLFIGLDYHYLYSHRNYKQSLLQMVKRARGLNVNRLYFGITASLEKRRLGATAIKKHVFVQLHDTYNMDVLSLSSGIKASIV